MGQYDSIKALASAGYTQPTESTFRTNNFFTMPMTKNRLPNETDAEYYDRLTAIERQQGTINPMDVLIQAQREKNKRNEEHIAKLKEENANYLLKRLNALDYNPNDIKSIEYALGNLSSIRNFYDYNLTGNGFDVSKLKAIRSKAEQQLENLQNGGQNERYFTGVGDKRDNAAAFEFQNDGEKNFLS